jgi:hypothetical protein
MICASENCKNKVMGCGRGRPKKYCSVRCRNNRLQRIWWRKHHPDPRKRIKKVYNVGEVTKDILDSLGKDDKPNQHGVYPTTPVQVFEGVGEDWSWNDHLDNLKVQTVPIKEG